MPQATPGAIKRWHVRTHGRRANAEVWYQPSCQAKTNGFTVLRWHQPVELTDFLAVPTGFEAVPDTTNLAARLKYFTMLSAWPDNDNTFLNATKFCLVGTAVHCVLVRTAHYHRNVNLPASMPHMAASMQGLL